MVNSMTIEDDNLKDNLKELDIYDTKILLLDDSISDLNIISEILKRAGFKKLMLASNLEEAKHLFKEGKPYIALLDYWLDPLPEGVHIDDFRSMDPSIPLVIVTAYGSLQVAISCIKLGAYDFLNKPIVPDVLVKKVENAIKWRYLQEETLKLRRRRKEMMIIGTSDSVKELYNVIDNLSLGDLPVIITGDSGTGKELVATTIHELSERKSYPLIAINCAAIPEELMESELFGHIKGAYTDAADDNEGYIKKVGRGTLFFDEVTELSLPMQAKLLELIESRKYRMVGSDEVKLSHARIMAATNKDILKEVEAGRFRSDLYYRINVLKVHLPPLKQRVEDVPLLCNHFIKIHRVRLKKEVMGFTSDALRFLLSHHWPGNIRELENLVQRCIVLTNTKWIEQGLLVSELGLKPAKKELKGYKETKKEVLKNFDVNYLNNLLKNTKGNVSEASRSSGIPSKSLWRKIKQYGIEPDKFREKG